MPRRKFKTSRYLNLDDLGFIMSVKLTSTGLIRVDLGSGDQLYFLLETKTPIPYMTYVGMNLNRLQEQHDKDLASIYAEHPWHLEKINFYCDAY